MIDNAFNLVSGPRILSLYMNMHYNVKAFVVADNAIIPHKKILKLV